MLTITLSSQPGWRQTAPVNPNYFEVTVAANDIVSGLEFGNTNDRFAGENVAPEFTSTPPTDQITTGERLLYRATDLNNDPLTFDLVQAPKGMAIAPNGVISWRPNDNLGLDYLRARYLDVDTGRFVSWDTFEGRLQNPITLHKYLYTNANPVLFTDPSGLFSILSVLPTNLVQTARFITTQAASVNTPRAIGGFVEFVSVGGTAEVASRNALSSSVSVDYEIGAFHPTI